MEIKLWITRNSMELLQIWKSIPKKHNWDGEVVWSDGDEPAGELDTELFADITIENSPQRIKIVLDA